MASLVACPDCAAIQELPDRPPRGRLECWRCDRVLERASGRSMDRALACGMAVLVLLFPANIYKLFTVVGPAGIRVSTHLGSGCLAVLWQGWPLLAAGTFLQGIFLPFLRFFLLTVTLAALRLGHQGRWLGPAFRYSERLDMWAMLDVFLLGAALGWGRIVYFVPVHIEAGGWCFVVAAFLTMITRASLDRRAVWRRIAAPAHEAAPDSIACVSCELVLPAELEEGRCPRCAARLHRRKPFAVMRATALVAATYILLPIANYFPMSTLTKLGTPHPHTIFRGVQLLFENGFAPLAVVVMCTSIGIPFGKTFGLTWCLASIRERSSRHLRLKTKLYRAIDEAGRWSNLDPFAVIIFVPLAQFGQLANIHAQGGAPAFLSTIIISMAAARLFDPRLMWDAAGETAHDAPAVLPEPELDLQLA